MTRRGECMGVVSGKGGTGKTSFTAGVGAALAQTGRRVLCIDCAAGLRNLDLAMGLSGAAWMDFTDVIRGRCSLEEAAAEHPRQPGLFLLNAPVRAERAAVTEREMTELLYAVRAAFDFCLLDAPAGIGSGFTLASCAADRMAVIATADPLSLRDAQRAVMQLERFPDGTAHVVVNRVRRLALSRMRLTIDDVMDQTGLPLLGLLPEDDAFPRALSQGLPVPLSAPKSAAAAACRHIAGRMNGRRMELARIRW